MTKLSHWALALMATTLGGEVAAAQDAPGTVGQFMIFFDWGKPDINRDAQILLDQVVAAYKSYPSARLQLTGHSDRSGPSAVNRAAGLKRAEQVRSYLAAKGIPASAIRVSSEGEDRPLVPTEDGVREVQNRRVEIQFDG